MDAMMIDTNPRGRKRMLSFGKSRGALTNSQSFQVKKVASRQQELKYFNYGIVAANFTTTAVITGVPFDVPQGITNVTRVGDSLTWAGHIDFKIQMLNSSGIGSDTYNTGRAVIFQWFANQTPIPTDVLVTGPTGNVDVLSQYNHDRRKEYLILFDKCLRTVGAGTSSTFPVVENFSTGVLDFNISLAKARKEVQFVGGGITGTNRLYLLLVSDSSTLPHPQIEYSTKVVFRDG